jgi:hypothetical protein
MIMCASIKNNYIPTNLKSLHTLRIKVAKKKKRSIAHGVLCTYITVIQIVMTDKSVRSFSVFVTLVLKGFTRSDAINQL